MLARWCYKLIRTDNRPFFKKSFSMMRYVSDHHGTDYEWFLRLDDDAYVHIEHLESLLRRIDSSQPLYIGSPGFGRDDDDFVEDNMVYCMGGPGIVLSKTTLASLSPKLGKDHHHGLSFRFTENGSYNMSHIAH